MAIRVRSNRVIYVLLSALFAWPSAASASSIFVNASFDAAPVNLFDVTPFDPSLGTLDSIHITINGVLTVTGLAPANGIADQSGFIPIPYQYRVDVEQDFDGVGGFFEFSTPATFLLLESAPGVASPFTLVVPFSYGLEFNATTDLIGFDIPTFSGASIPPVSVVGPRSGFVESAVSPNQILLSHTASAHAVTGPVPIVTSFGADGAVLMEYRYTPLAVPEPGSLLLVGFGLLSTLAAQRHRRRRRS